MALWSDWSDGTKWFMGIMGTIVAFLLTTGMTLLVRPFRSPLFEPPGTPRKTKVIIEHLGAKDPEQEGFTNGYVLALPEQQRQWNKIGLMPWQDPSSWRINNPVSGAVPYRYQLNNEQLNEARSKGWRITLQARFLTLTDPLKDPEGGIFANFYTDVRRYDLMILRAFPREGNNNALKVRLINHVLAGNSTTGQEAPNVRLIDGDKSHRYVMTYDPAGTVAKVEVDEEEWLKDIYKGHTDYTRDRPFFIFGTTGADATFTLVRFEIFQ